MATRRTRSFKVDFYVVTQGGERRNTFLRDLLAAGSYTTAHPLDGDAEERYQVRSVVRTGQGRVFKAVFGRCRFGEQPEQGTDDGSEADVELLPGHGLVAKNHFLFYATRNLLVYQRNSTGSHIARFQRYLNIMSGGVPIALEPILTTDAYERLLQGGEVKAIDLSFQLPSDPALYEGLPLDEAVRLGRRCGALNTRIRMGVGHSKRRLQQIKEAAVVMAKLGFAKVARVKLDDEAEPIDLIADRIIESAIVGVGANGRPAPEDIYAALDEAATNRRDDLATFFGR